MVLIRRHILIEHIVIMLLLFGALPAARFLHLNLHLESLLLLPLLFLFAVFVKVNLVLDLLLVEELDTLVEDIQMHLDDLRLVHEADVLIGVSAGLALFRARPSGGLVRLLRIEVHQLQGVLTGKIFEVLDVLEVHLVENFLKIFRPNSSHVDTKFEFLLLGKHLDESVTGEGLLLGRLLVILLGLQHLEDLLLLLPLEMLVHSVLH